MSIRKRSLSVLIVIVALVLLAGCAAPPTPVPQVVKETVVVTQVVPATSAPVTPVAAATSVPATAPAAASATLKFASGSGKINDPYVVGWDNTNITAVDFVFVGAMASEITATQMALSNPTWYNLMGRPAVVGEVPNVPGFKALAMASQTQPVNADAAITFLPFYFPPKGDKYALVTLGGIAGGFNTQFVPGAPDLQPGDSLAAAGSCNVTFNTFQPALTNGYVVVGTGDTFDSIAERLAGSKAKGTELYNYNAKRMRYASPSDLKVGHVLLTPDTWPPSTVTSFGLPRGVSLIVNGKSYSLKAENPCIYLSAAALALRDETLKRMDLPALPNDVVEYRTRNFKDARTSTKVFSGDWNEGGGNGWFGDPWIARDLQSVFHVAMSDMETYFHQASFASRWPGKLELEPGTTTIKRLETDNILIYRTSSDPPDMYRGKAFPIADFVKDPTGTTKAVQAAYRGDDTPDAIPFASLTAGHSAQFRNFNFTAAQIVASKQNSAIKLPEPKPTEAPKPTTAATAAPTTAPTAAPTTAPAAVAPTTAPTAAASTTAPTAAASSAPVTFGMVLVGPQNDHGWSEAHYLASQYVKSKMPNVSWVYLDKMNSADRPGTTLEQVVTDMASKGIKLIFTTSDDFQTDTITAAQKHPELTFINVSGDSAWKDGKNYKDLKNLGNFMGQMEYMKMVAGCAAALTTQTGKIGFLGPLLNDETRRLTDSAYLGAKYCWTTYAKKNAADLKFDVKWIGFWFNIPGVTLDPTKVANDFYNAGNDVVISGIDTTEALVVAGQRQKQGQKVWAVSYDYKEGCAEAPDACLGVPYFNWGPRYLKEIQAFTSGKWQASWSWDAPNLKDPNNVDASAAGFTYGKALSAENKGTVDKFIGGLADGSIKLFKGPITLQDGTVYVKEGATATDKEIWYLPQLLQGMTGQSVQAK